MKTGDLLNPSAYPRLARSCARLLRDLVRQWPDMRAASAQWPRWILRRLFAPLRPVPLILTSRTGIRCELGDDPVDDAIFAHVHGGSSILYFPPLPNGEPDGLILDVGAHHGIYAMEALRRYPQCDLIAVEPDPAACTKIEANARLNNLSSRIEIVGAGLAGADGQGSLVMDAHGSWASRTRAADTGSTSDVRVELKTLASILRGRRVAIVKSNAEGAEFALVPQLIAGGHRPRLIVLMAHPEAGSPDELVRMLSAVGYHVRDADAPARGCRFHCVRPGDLPSLSGTRDG